MAALKFDGSIHKLEVFDEAGSLKGSWIAYNNIDKAYARDHYNGITHLLDGVYPIKDKVVPGAHKPDPNGEYGLYGIIRFIYPGHAGVGVHAGRAAHVKHKAGPQNSTHGCIRTTDIAMLAIREIMAKDPLQTITVIRNNSASATQGQLMHASKI